MMDAPFGYGATGFAKVYVNEHRAEMGWDVGSGPFDSSASKACTHRSDHRIMKFTRASTAPHAPPGSILDGSVQVPLKQPWSNGTLTPLELVEHLVAE